MGKKMLCVILAVVFSLAAAGCVPPDSKQLDIYTGSSGLKLLHLNVNNNENIAKIDFFRSVIDNAEPTDKPISLLGYYPDYRLTFKERGQEDFTVIIDLTGDRVEFYYPGPSPEASETVYLSAVTSGEFLNIVHSASA